MVADRLAGKVALITGGSKGIGLATAIRFAREGAAVAITGRGTAALAEAARQVDAAGGPALALVADAADEAQTRAAVEQTVARFGGLDVLVANAGATMPHAHISEVGLAEWKALMAVNVDGLFLAAKYAAPAMRRRGGGSIVVLASDSSFVAVPGMVAYCTSKGAALMFTKALAVDLERDGIRVNCVCPSVVDTPMLRGFLGDVEPAAAGMDQLHTADQIAGHILFLASDEAATINGAALVEDFGGLAKSTFPA
jgi:dihydroanticapsin dehydrogenase